MTGGGKISGKVEETSVRPTSARAGERFDEQIRERIKQSVRRLHSLSTPLWALGFMRIVATCGCCGRSLTLKHLSDRKAGIKMAQQWYCSSRCFTSAAEKQFAQQLTAVQVQAPRIPRMPLGLHLISRGSITNEQYQLAISEQKHAEGEIGEVLVRLGFVTEKEVTVARASQWGYPVFTLPNGEVRSGVHLPPTLIKLYSMLPLYYVPATRRLMVGFVHGVEYGLLYTIEQMTGFKTEPCFVTPTDFRAQLLYIKQMQETGEVRDALVGSKQKKSRRKRIGVGQELELDEVEQDRHEQSVAEQSRQDAGGYLTTGTELKYEGVRNASEMARMLCRHAVAIEADEAFIGKSRDYVWARLTSGETAVDILFRVG